MGLGSITGSFWGVKKSLFNKHGMETLAYAGHMMLKKKSHDTAWYVLRSGGANLTF